MRYASANDAHFVLFRREAWFNNADFSSDTRFVQVAFLGTTRFVGTGFAKTEWFDEATYAGGETFNKALFTEQREAVFQKVQCEDLEALVRGATFGFTPPDMNVCMSAGPRRTLHHPLAPGM